MAFKRSNIPFFELANAAYSSSIVTFFEVDPVTSAQLQTLITLYNSSSGPDMLPNPCQLDSSGKFSVPTYAEERFIAVVTDVNGVSQTTGLWEPSLSDADVAAAAASATAAAASDTDAAFQAVAAAASAATAVAAAAEAIVAVGAVNVTTSDTTPLPLNQKATVSGLVTKQVLNPSGNATLNLDVSGATNLQALAKASNTVVLTPGNLAALNGDEVTTGLVRFATAAEATTGTITTAALTPAGGTALAANTVVTVRGQGVFYNAAFGI